MMARYRLLPLSQLDPLLLVLMTAALRIHKAGFNRAVICTTLVILFSAL
jgi:hypothetical protein